MWLNLAHIGMCGIQAHGIVRAWNARKFATMRSAMMQKFVTMNLQTTVSTVAMREHRGEAK
jgi:hypothetical protein